ncbi:MAG: endonuclease domain-containing protein [Candidatus Sphingomonas phytovorans]|nr:endonuclease domain-containing protein [Sphingomonas sp.]WEK02568.1 MAG: endonuclease domain-containing protein [Sphingomonas sp.]
MRRNPTEPEKRLWRHLSNGQLGAYKFRRQHVVADAYAIMDFFCPAIGLGIEVDGDTHNADEDMRRDSRLKHRGFTILRFSNADVMTNIEGVVETIFGAAQSLPSRWSGSRRPPPQPLP